MVGSLAKSWSSGAATKWSPYVSRNWFILLSSLPAPYESTNRNGPEKSNNELKLKKLPMHGKVNLINFVGRISVELVCMVAMWLLFEEV